MFTTWEDIQTGVWTQASAVAGLEFLSFGLMLLAWTQKSLRRTTKWKYNRWDPKKLTSVQQYTKLPRIESTIRTENNYNGFPLSLDQLHHDF